MFGIFGSKNRKPMMEAVKEAGTDPAVTLVDVRSPEEYRQGHVPGAINLPLESLNQASLQLQDKQAKLYLYCHSGARSGMAARMLERMGYQVCINIGGIGAYTGKLER